MSDQFISFDDTAKFLGVTPQELHYLISIGQLECDNSRIILRVRDVLKCKDEAEVRRLDLITKLNGLDEHLNRLEYLIIQGVPLDARRQEEGINPGSRSPSDPPTPN